MLKIKKNILLFILAVAVFQLSGCILLPQKDGINLDFEKIEFNEQFISIDNFDSIAENICECLNLVIKAYNKSDRQNLNTLVESEELGASMAMIVNYSKFSENYSINEQKDILMLLLPCMGVNALVAQIKLDQYISGTGPVALERFEELRQSIEVAYQSYETGDISFFRKQ